MINLEPFFIQAFGNPKTLRNNQRLFFCPSCNHKKRKMEVNFVLGLGRCWVCDLKTRNLLYILKRYAPQYLPKNINAEEFEVSSNDTIIEEKHLELPRDIQSVKQGTTSIIDNAYNFLKNRGISDSLIEQYEIGFLINRPYENRLFFPSRDEDGKYNYYSTRSTNATGSSYIHANYPKEDVVIFENKIDWKQPVILTEGIFDAIKINYNSTPVLGSKLIENSYLFTKILEESPTIYLSFDNDRAGIAGTIHTAKTLIDYNIDTYYINLGKYKDPGEMSRSEFFQQCKNKERIDEFWIMEKELDCV